MQPTSDNFIRIVPHPARLHVVWNGKVVADTTEALVLHEGSSPGVRYVPRSDVDMTLLSLSTRKTRCPHKGEAFYFSLGADGKSIENAIWSYEAPFPAAAQIGGYLAFDPKYVEFVENNDGPL